MWIAWTMKRPSAASFCSSRSSTPAECERASVRACVCARCMQCVRAMRACSIAHNACVRGVHILKHHNMNVSTSAQTKSAFLIHRNTQNTKQKKRTFFQSLNVSRFPRYLDVNDTGTRRRLGSSNLPFSHVFVSPLTIYIKKKGVFA